MEDKSIETWNMANETLKRYNLKLIQSSFCSQNGDLKGWFEVLMDLRRDLFPYLTDKQYNKVMEKFNSLPRNWRFDRRFYAETNQKFDDIYMFFIKIMKDKGLLLPKSVDTSKSVMEM